MKALAIVAALATTAHAKDPDVATALSGVGTGVSSALVVSAFLFRSDREDLNRPLFIAGLGSSIITPSLGQLYSREYWTWGMVVRAGAAALGTIAVLTEEETVRCDNGQTDCKSLKGAGLALLGLAAIGYIGGVAYDVMDAGDAAKRANGQLSLRLVPSGTGLALVGTF